MEDHKLREADQIQKAVKKAEMKSRQLQNKLSEMKAETTNLQKHNKEYKDYFDKQQERMGALRNVNQNLSKKLQQKQAIAVRQEPGYQEMERHCQQASARAQNSEKRAQ